MSTKIIKATKKNINEAGYLFDLYRQFYKYKSNIKASTNYIKDRINKKDSFIFLCLYQNQPAGFLQLYETFDSLNINKKLILYSLSSPFMMGPSWAPYFEASMPAYFEP